MLSIFWRALLTTKDDEGTWTDEDMIKVEAFLASSRKNVLNNMCGPTIYFAPLYGEPPFLACQSSMHIKWVAVLVGRI